MGVWTPDFFPNLATIFSESLTKSRAQGFSWLAGQLATGVLLFLLLVLESQAARPGFLCMCWESMSSLHAYAPCTSPPETPIPTEMVLGKLKDAQIKCGSKSRDKGQQFFLFNLSAQRSWGAFHSKYQEALHPRHSPMAPPFSLRLYGSKSARPSHLPKSSCRLGHGN